MLLELPEAVGILGYGHQERNYIIHVDEARAGRECQNRTLRYGMILGEILTLACVLHNTPPPATAHTCDTMLCAMCISCYCRQTMFCPHSSDRPLVATTIAAVLPTTTGRRGLSRVVSSNTRPRCCLLDSSVLQDLRLYII
jgi:hypothetical protein